MGALAVIFPHRVREVFSKFIDIMIDFDELEGMVCYLLV